MSLLPMVASAYDDLRYEEIPGYDAKIDGIYYKFTGQSEAKVSYELYIIHIGITNDGEIMEGYYHTSDYSGDVVIPESFTYNDNIYRVTGINEYAFEGCTGLTSVTIPSSVTNMGAGVFSGCTGLTSVTIPSSITNIGANAFYGCKGLTSITIPSTVTDIGANAFENCTGLTSITIPQNVTMIGKEFIKGCSALTDIYCLPENPPAATNAFSYNSISNITLHVPEGSEQLYEATIPWSYFFATLPDGSILINEINFPDPFFRDEVKKLSVGLDGVLTADEMASVKSLEFYRGEYYSDWCGPIKSLQGIEFFPELTNLRCDEIYLTELDLTKNPKIKDVWCYCETLKRVNASGCTALRELNCQCRQTEYVDISGCTSLTTQDWNSHRLIELNASGCTSLTTLYCEANNLNKLDVSGCTALTLLKFWKNKLKGEGMDALVESLPTTNSGTLYAYWVDSKIHDQNVMSIRQVAAAKAKGWKVKSSEYGNIADYAGAVVTEVINFTQGQMATIILPTAPDASKGRYYRLDRHEDGHIVFVQELQPQARTPYIIVPTEDFSVEVDDTELGGLEQDFVAMDGIYFFGSYRRREIKCPEGCYIDIIDTTPDCQSAASPAEMSVVGALRAYLIVRWDDPIDHGSPKEPPTEKMGIVLLDDPDGINEIQNEEMVNGKLSNGKCFDLSGRRQSAPQKGLNILRYADGTSKKVILK